MSEDGDVLIVGGGVAGLSAAARLGAFGHRVLVVDKAPLPRDKVCGEGLMPMGLECLRELGLNPATLPGDSFCGLEYRSRGRRTQMDFPPHRLGRGVRRTVLIAALQRQVAGQATVSQHSDRVREPIWQDGRVVGLRGERGSYRARVVLAADGVHSGLARGVGAELRPYGERMALRRHYRLPVGLKLPRVCVGLFSPHDVYLTPVGSHTLLATTMTDRAGYRVVVGRYDAFLREGPYGALFEQAEPASEQLGWHHPLFAPRSYVAGGMLLTGDAGGGVDPCLGVGISMALASALLAARAATGILAEPARRGSWERGFDGQRKILFRHFNVFGKVFRFAVQSQRGSEWLLAGMQHWPAVAESLLDIVATGRRWRTFPWPALLQPLWTPLRGAAGDGPGADVPRSETWIDAEEANAPTRSKERG